MFYIKFKFIIVNLVTIKGIYGLANINFFVLAMKVKIIYFFKILTITMNEKYRKLWKIVKKELKGASPAHDISHVMRVYDLCLLLAKYEKNVDLDVLKTAALLHNIARVKESQNVDHAVLGAEISEKILR